MTDKARVDRRALGALLTGTLALVAIPTFYPLALVLGVAAVALGFSGLGRIRQLRALKGRGLAYWGMSTGAVGFVIAFFLAAVAAVVTEDPRIQEVIREELERQRNAQ